MLSLQNIHVHYGLSHIIHGIDLDVTNGEVVGIFGRNGVGKTTLLRTIAGWIKPSDGHVRLAGENIEGMAPDRICRKGVGFVPEDRRIFPGLTVEENLTLGFLQVPQRSRAENQAALDAVYRRLPRLKERRAQLGTTLSGGEQQMLAMARVMIGDAKLLLIDEPSEGLAPMIVDDVYAVISEMKAENRTILLVEQNVSLALKVCDRFVAIERGKIVLAGSARNESDCKKLFEVIAV
ncbi:MAG TPA: ABC transporter ATP-binding protein [Xanthobacteraceae bacterium]|mgnify:FL=1|nr:ABC transporter ATP-binding protein [Xanthobacteraceae bacterium]